MNKNKRDAVLRYFEARYQYPSHLPKFCAKCGAETTHTVGESTDVYGIYAECSKTAKVGWVALFMTGHTKVTIDYIYVGRFDTETGEPRW